MKNGEDEGVETNVLDLIKSDVLEDMDEDNTEGDSELTRQDTEDQSSAVDGDAARI